MQPFGFCQVKTRIIDSVGNFISNSRLYGQYPRIKYNNFGYNTRYISSGVFKLRFRQSLRQAPSPLLISGLESLMRENSSKSWLANLGESIKNDVSLFLSSAAGKYSRLFRLTTSAGKQNPCVVARTKAKQIRTLYIMLFRLFFKLIIFYRLASPGWARHFLSQKPLPKRNQAHRIAVKIFFTLCFFCNYCRGRNI